MIPEERAPETARRAHVLATHELSRDFGDIPALRSISLSLDAGETMVVLGPNGAGKTTLLRILATLLRPSAGEVQVLGAELPRQAWRARGRIGYLGHDPMLYRDLTVVENLRFHGRLHRVEPLEQRIDRLLAMVELGLRRDELVRNLSAGMVQRAAVCRAVLHDPELLLLDEPRSHLDPVAAELVEPLIGPGGGRTRVLVTHDLDAALSEADRAVVLEPGGRVHYAGSARDLSGAAARAAYGSGA